MTISYTSTDITEDRKVLPKQSRAQNHRGT